MTYRVLFYNAFFGAYPPFRRFDSVPEVEFLTDRARLREADAVVFHLPEAAQIRDAVKYPGQIWVGWSMESRLNTRVRGEAAMAAFDLHMGFERGSDVWCPYLPALTAWEAARLQAPAPTTETASTVLFQSANTDHSGRNAYLAELMGYLRFDSYGRFLRNRPSPSADLGPAGKLEVVRRYRFALGFENSIEPDYVTEKFFQPLLAGSVPVYRGAPNVAEFAPGKHCYIDASHYSPRDLAAYLGYLAANEAEYARFHAWRTQPLRPAFLRLLEAARGEALERLAEMLRTKLQARGARPDGRPVRPFGWRGWADTRWRPANLALRRLRRSLSFR